MKFLSGFITFTGKEFLELRRSGRLLIFTVIFVLLGVMNPATAKLTPWLMETMADSLEASGLTITEYTVTAMDSWVQFFKNMPSMGLLITVVMFGGFFTSEYAKGTLIPLLAKGLSRSAFASAKTFTMLLVWSAGYWLSYGITFARRRGIYRVDSGRNGRHRQPLSAILPTAKRRFAHGTGAAYRLHGRRLHHSRRFFSPADGFGSFHR